MASLCAYHLPLSRYTSSPSSNNAKLSTSLFPSTPINLSSKTHFSLQFLQTKPSSSPSTSRSLVVKAMAPPKGKVKKVIGMIKLALEAGKATPAPPVGPALGSKGVNIMAFCKDYNAKTADKAGYVIPVEITVYDDKSFTFILKTPPASVLLLKAAGVEKGSKDPKMEKVGKVTIDQLRTIATEKLPDLNCSSIDSAMRIIAGTAANMGIEVDPPVVAAKDVVGTYCKEVRGLGFRLLGYISMSLGLEEDYMDKQLGDQGQHMAVNYYPPCPQPDLTYGLPRHTDPNTITILLQGQEVAGLQVLHNGKWVAVNPYPNAFVVNIGDQIQALSNGKYKSVWHRAIVNNHKERISVASFLCPANDAVIGPAIKDESPAIYKKFTYDEYYKKFWSGNLDEEHCLELFKN